LSRTSYAIWKWRRGKRNSWIQKNELATGLTRTSYAIWKWRKEKEIAECKKMNKPMHCLKLHMRYENEEEKKEIGEWEKMNKQLDCLKLHMRYESEGEEKEIGEWEKMNKQKSWRISSYIWSKVVVCDSDIRNFIQIRPTQQWSSFSRMILWWSDCSASTTVLQQLTSNVKWIVYDEKKSLSKLLRQLFK